MDSHNKQGHIASPATDSEVDEIMSNEVYSVASVRTRSRAGSSRSLSAVGSAIFSTRWTIRRVFIFLLLSLVYFLTYACLSLMSAFFTIEAQKKGVNNTVIGFIFGMYPLMAFFSALMYGAWLMPQWGPNFVLLTGLVLNGGAHFLFAYVENLPSGAVYILFCFLIRTVSAFGGSACENAVLAILIGEFPENVSAIVSALEIFAGISFALGPVAGGGLYTVGGFKLPFLVMGAALFVSIPTMWILLPKIPGVAESRDGKLPVTNILFIPGVILVAIQLTIGTSLFAFLDPTLAPFAEKLGLNAAYIGLLFMVISLSYALSTVVVGWICEKTKAFRTCLVMSFVLIGIGLLFLGPAPFLDPYIPQKQIWLICISLALNGIGGSLFFIPCVPEMQRCCLDRSFTSDLALNSMLSGIFTGASNFGGFAGPVLGGALVEKLGFPWMATVMSFLSLFLVVLTVVWNLCSSLSHANVTSEEKKPLLGAANRTTNKI
ncbi:MFS-type transporter SLC18B1 isoform X2 [Nematostella vectensis]|uniref:MFS-type transporter SLC18B1 isoform X2 n=1 Tax=Nematostella vectensis TaxID=45351 RepID=UPI0020770AD9|nr:MFS-type transporter SLC18B1 isoform X2 [Nematostella vectensis]